MICQLHRTKTCHESDIMATCGSDMNMPVRNIIQSELWVEDFTHERRSQLCLVVVIVKPEKYSGLNGI